jgi:hypothetical protein
MMIAEGARHDVSALHRILFVDVRFLFDWARGLGFWSQNSYLHHPVFIFAPPLEPNFN